MTRLLTLIALALPASLSSQSRPMPAERRALAFLIGEFEGEVQLANPDGSPGARSTMRYRADWDLDSAWVAARYEQPHGNRTVRGLLLYTWDASAKRYLYYGVPNHAMEPARMQGTMVGSSLVYETVAGASGSYRETWEAVGLDTLVNTLSFRRDGAWVTGSRAILVRSEPGKGRW